MNKEDYYKIYNIKAGLSCLKSDLESALLSKTESCLKKLYKKSVWRDSFQEILPDYRPRNLDHAVSCIRILLSSNSKGSLGENTIFNLFHPGAELREKSNTEHDRVYRGLKWEAKLACINHDRKGHLKWQHIKIDYDYDVLCLFGIYPKEFKMWYLWKSDVIELNRIGKLKSYKTSIKKHAANEYLTVDKFLKISGLDTPDDFRQYEVPLKIIE